VTLVLFGVWNVAMWSARVRNIVGDPDLDTTGRLWWSLPAVLFAAGGAVALLRRWLPGTAAGWVVRAAASCTVVYWPVRTVLLVGNGHAAGFVAVHVVLAVVSVGLATAVLLRFRPAR